MLRIRLLRAVEHGGRWLTRGQTLSLPADTARLWARVGLAEIVEPPKNEEVNHEPNRRPKQLRKPRGG
ncbi:hypothetical protein MGR01S_28020 [Meiothermus granaticius NBRC 107808]|uniref:Uncharacterized protein n=1 Tax=Meiothermus granaticius NBRC 107808 TaxID=1227551 RepID=A0A399FBL2_9DEIN|nr:hypothetical protein Mgrana_00080 [Meiothermus granaticius NBRC 107808]GEM88177.1 hypothetical protein MGR01S_28020 [Meiothermus granaticius NBRC 107808]